MKERNRGLTEAELQELKDGLKDEKYTRELESGITQSLSCLSDKEIEKLQAELENARNGKTSFGQALSRIVGDTHQPALEIYAKVADEKPSLFKGVLGGLFGRK